jgi:hypothetical protein
VLNITQTDCCCSSAAYAKVIEDPIRSQGTLLCTGNLSHTHR